MSGVTNDLVKKSKLISNNFDKAEYDSLLATGEQASCALIAGGLNDIGLKSRSWLAWQIPILTSGPHSGARIENIESKILLKFMKSGGIPIITGFQGINSNFRITTLGRGGSDASAIMLAKFLKADECIIYTDVDGVYTTDPRLHKKAKKIKKIFYDEMLEMASLGSKVMQPTSVQDAKLTPTDDDSLFGYTQLRYIAGGTYNPNSKKVLNLHNSWRFPSAGGTRILTFHNGTLYAICDGLNTNRFSDNPDDRQIKIFSYSPDKEIWVKENSTFERKIQTNTGDILGIVRALTANSFDNAFYLSGQYSSIKYNQNR